MAEIHLNLQLNKIRVYSRKRGTFEFDGIITGPPTRSVIGTHKVISKNKGPTPKKKLLNYVQFHKNEIGFHSDHLMKNGKKVRIGDAEPDIPGLQSHGCARIKDSESEKFFNLVKVGDSVFVYEESGWQQPRGITKQKSVR